MRTPPTHAEPIATMTEEEAWTYLATQQVGRLALRAGARVDVFPLAFAVDNHTIVFRTTPGTKLLVLTLNESVAFEVDSWDDTLAHSVVVHGRARRIESRGEIDLAENLPIASLVQSERFRFVRISPDKISGRVFLRGE